MNVEGLKEIVHWILMEVYQVRSLEVRRCGGTEVSRRTGVD